jgi:hypothetical protein
MATTSLTALRRFAGFAFSLTLFSLCLAGLAKGQGSPLVTASSAAGLSHPTGWGTIQETAIDQAGDWFVVDYANGALYEFPAGGGAAITVAGASPTASLGGGYQNPVVLIDPGNNLYLGANWNNCLLLFPWNAATKTWTGLTDGGAKDLSPSNPTTTMCTNSGSNNEAQAWAQYSVSDLTGSGLGYFQPWAVAVGNNNNLIIGDQGGSNGIDVRGQRPPDGIGHRLRASPRVRSPSRRIPKGMSSLLRTVEPPASLKSRRTRRTGSIRVTRALFVWTPIFLP